MQQAIDKSSLGALVIGPQNLVAQIAEKRSHTIIFSFKEIGMLLSPELENTNCRGQVYRINVNTQQADAWYKVTRTIHDVIDARLSY